MPDLLGTFGNLRWGQTLITLGPRILVQVVLLTTFLYFFGFPAVARFAKKEVMVVETSKDTRGIPSPAITIALVNQIKNDSCFEKDASIEHCLERDTLNRSEILRRVIIGWKRQKEIHLTQENLREDFTLNYAGRYYTLDLPMKIGPDDHEDELFLELNINLTYTVLIHDRDYFLYNTNPIALPTTPKRFSAKDRMHNSWFYRLELAEVNRLNLPSSPCIEDPSYNFQACLRRSITEKVCLCSAAGFFMTGKHKVNFFVLDWMQNKMGHLE